jgi:hypothetical protein
MDRLPRWISSAALLGATVVCATAMARTETAPADSTTVTITAELAAAAALPTTALDREVAAIRAAFSARLNELAARYRSAPDAAAAAAAQREITAHKMKLELDLLDLQLRLARERRDTAAVAELEQFRTAASERLVADTGLEVPAAAAGGANR